MSLAFVTYLPNLNIANESLGSLSSSPIPNSQNLSISSNTTKHNKRIRIPALSLLDSIRYPYPRTRPTILLPIRKRLHHPQKQTPPHRRPSPQRPRLQHARRSPPSSRYNISPNPRRLLFSSHRQKCCKTSN